MNALYFYKNFFKEGELALLTEPAHLHIIKRKKISIKLDLFSFSFIFLFNFHEVENVHKVECTAPKTPQSQFTLIL